MAGRGRGKANTLPAWMTGTGEAAAQQQSYVVPSAASYGLSIASHSGSNIYDSNSEIDANEREKNRQAAASFIKSFQFIRFPTAVSTNAIDDIAADRKKRRFSDNSAPGSSAAVAAAPVKVVHKLPSQQYAVQKPANQTVIHMAYPGAPPAQITPPTPTPSHATQISQGYLHYYAPLPAAPHAYADPMAQYQQQMYYHQHQYLQQQERLQQQQQPAASPAAPAGQYDFSRYYQQQQQQQQQQQRPAAEATAGTSFDWFNQSVKAASAKTHTSTAYDDIAAKKSSLMQYLSDNTTTTSTTSSSSSSSNKNEPAAKITYITSFSTNEASAAGADSAGGGGGDDDDDDDDGEDDTSLPMFKRIRKGCKVSCKYKTSILLAEIVSVMHKGYTNCVCDVKFDGYEKILTVPIDDITYIMKFPQKTTKAKVGVTAADCVSAVAAVSGSVIDSSILNRGSSYWRQ